MAYFQLLTTSHVDLATGKKYIAGDIVGPVERDFVRSFGPNKFRRLSDKEIAQLQNDEAHRTQGTHAEIPDAVDAAETDEQPRRVKRHKRKSA